MENIPDELKLEQESSTLGKRSFDMQVDFSPDTTVHESIIARIPQTVLDTVLGYSGVARLVIEIVQVQI